ncbi:MAG: hypothetical protein WDO13_00995 [Verrucomicrobiota bacterium]
MIHNPEVNDQLREMGIKQLKETRGVYDLNGLNEGRRRHRAGLRRGGEGGSTGSRTSAAGRSTPPVAT